MDAPWMIAAAVETEIRGLRKRLKNATSLEMKRGRAWKGQWKQ